MDLRVGLQRKLSAEELMLLNYDLGQDSWKSLGNPKGNQSWILTGETDAEAEALILRPPVEKSRHWKRPWCWERLKVGGEGDDRGWDDWNGITNSVDMVWVNSGSWWWTGRPGVLQSMGSQRVRHDSTETELIYKITNKDQHKELHLIFYKKNLKRNICVC